MSMVLELVVVSTSPAPVMTMRTALLPVFTRGFALSP
jgi:hypothetical protein